MIRDQLKTNKGKKEQKRSEMKCPQLFQLGASDKTCGESVHVCRAQLYRRGFKNTLSDYARPSAVKDADQGESKSERANILLHFNVPLPAEP
ncbi:uncharacterized protein IAS62_001783 [Cryptococcus decagattii]|uniref:Uncharacterized protein n=1 Tax=Cryptococcus decagattii TaxID=1859122 RepID=A0ABZ2APN8_9TREE